MRHYLLPGLLVGMIFLFQCAAPARLRGIPRSSLVGVASYYGSGFHGKRTANGERFDMHGMTAAHRYLPFNTRVKVINLANGKSVIVRINDRGPFAKSRVVDLSYGAARKIGLVRTGVAKVRLEVLR